MFAEEGVVECTVQTETAVLHPEIRKLQRNLWRCRQLPRRRANDDASADPAASPLAPAPPPKPLPKPCLHSAKPAVKNGNESRSKSHTTGLSCTAAVWHCKSTLGRRTWRFKQRWQGRCRNPQITGHVGLSYEQHLLPPANTSNLIPRWSKRSGPETNVFWANSSWQTLRLVTSMHTMPSSLPDASTHVRASFPSQTHWECSLLPDSTRTALRPYVQFINHTLSHGAPVNRSVWWQAITQSQPQVASGLS